MSLFANNKDGTHRRNTAVDDEIEEKIKVMAKGCMTTLQVGVPQMSRSLILLAF